MINSITCHIRPQAAPLPEAAPAIERLASREQEIPSKCPICGRGGEPPVTFAAAAKELGLPLWKLRRAAKAGTFPTYRLHDTRALCFVDEIRAAILASRKGEEQ